MSTVRLMREVRFSLGSTGEPAATGNSWAGVPSVADLVPHVTARVVLSGPVDERTGYVCNVKEIDRLVRDRIVPELQPDSGPCRTTSIAGRMGVLWQAVQPCTPAGARLESLRLAPTPHLSFEIRRGDAPMVRMTYAFEFSAAHRLYSDRLSEEENRRTFGKCANPNGHGHNYVVEIALQGEPDPRAGALFPTAKFENIVNERVIIPFDHKHLNLDVPAFADLNPTVENIARVIFGLLRTAFAPAELALVRVHETAKTYAEYCEP